MSTRARRLRVQYPPVLSWLVNLFTRRARETVHTNGLCTPRYEPPLGSVDGRASCERHYVAIFPPFTFIYMLVRLRIWGRRGVYARPTFLTSRVDRMIESRDHKV